MEIKEYDLDKRWELKRNSIYNLRDKIDKLKRLQLVEEKKVSSRLKDPEVD
jgi:hypothetical protein